MALWNGGATWSSGILWGPTTPVVSGTQRTQPKTKPMKRQPYYPRAQSQRAEWHSNLATKLPGYAAALPLPTADTNETVADNLVLAYGLGDWITSVRDFAPACTSSLGVLESGAGDAAFEFPTIQVPPPPTLPAPITAVKPGALDRVFRMAARIKTLPGYTEAIGLDLGIVGSLAPDPLPTDVPRIKVEPEMGQACECARVSFFKDGHQGIILESRRGGGDWQVLGSVVTKSPFLDERALLVPGQAEVREYRARFWDDGKGTSDWCDVAKVTLSP